MKTEKELEELKNEVAGMAKKLSELTKEELYEVVGVNRELTEEELGNVAGGKPVDLKSIITVYGTFLVYELFTPPKTRSWFSNAD